MGTEEDVLLRGVRGGRQNGEDIAVGLFEVLQGSGELHADTRNVEIALGVRVFLVEGGLDGFEVFVN